MKKTTQYDRIYQYIKQNGSISPKEAFPLGITKLATRISEMTKDGTYSVKKTWDKDKDGTRYMRYSKIVKKRKVTA